MSDVTTLGRAVQEAAAVLRAAGIDSAPADAAELAAYVLGVGRADVARRRALGEGLTDDQVAVLGALVTRRAQRVPLQHLTGVAHFRRLSLAVGPGVFVPRPETEVTVGLALAAATDAAVSGYGAGYGSGHGAQVRLVDLCAGSGAIVLAVVTEAAAAGVEVRAVAVELSPEAAVWTRRNAGSLGLGRVEVRSQGVEGCCPDLDGMVDVVTANPPYIPDDAIPRDPEVRDHDPALALYGGPDGLDVTRQVATAAARLCRPGGVVVVEHGEYQGEEVAAVLEAAGFVDLVTHLDLTGRPRVTAGTLPL